MSSGKFNKRFENLSGINNETGEILLKLDTRRN